MMRLPNHVEMCHLPLFSFKLIHPFPQFVDQSFLLLLKSIFQFNLLSSQLLQVVLLDMCLGFELLNFTHELVNQTLLLLLQCLL